MALFLGFLAISVYQDDFGDEQGSLLVATLEANVAEPAIFRHAANQGFMPELCLKDAGSCILVAMFGIIPAKIAVSRDSPLKANLRRFNPFYVFITTNAP